MWWTMVWLGALERALLRVLGGWLPWSGGWALARRYHSRLVCDDRAASGTWWPWPTTWSCCSSLPAPS